MSHCRVSGLSIWFFSPHLTITFFVSLLYSWDWGGFCFYLESSNNLEADLVTVFKWSNYVCIRCTVWFGSAQLQVQLGAARIYALPQVGRRSVAQIGDFLFDNVLLWLSVSCYLPHWVTRMSGGSQGAGSTSFFSLLPWKDCISTKLSQQEPPQHFYPYMFRGVKWEENVFLVVQEPELPKEIQHWA